MKSSFVKIVNLVPSLKVSDVDANVKEIERLFLANQGADIYLTPELSLVGYSSQDLFFLESLLIRVEKGLAYLASITKNEILFVGAPLRKGNALYNCAVALNNGKIIGVVPKSYIPNYGEFYEKRWFRSGRDIKNSFIDIDGVSVPFGTDLLFSFDQKVIIGAEICEDLWVNNAPHIGLVNAGATIILNLSGSDETIGKSVYRKELVKMASSLSYCGYSYCSSGSDESSQDLVYSGHNIIASCGRIIAEKRFMEKEALSGLVDLDEIMSNRIRKEDFENEESDYRFIPFSLNVHDTKDIVKAAEDLKNEGLEVSPFPFVPSSEEERAKRALEILEIQSRGLYTRLKNIGANVAVIGVSGGLDSTLALLVLNLAKKLLPSLRIIGVTLPNRGNTSDLTYKNAISLLDELGVEKREISIESSVQKHLNDIGHPSSYMGEGDVTYENAQARMRTYILMDIANMEKGLVIGTGDLSELALGWCTYNGDHMSMYGVNASIPKTLVSYLVESYAESYASSALKKTLYSVIDTPISPELTPMKNGEINQKTEEKIGKYDLNDFFLFYTLRYGYSVSKIATLALIAYPNLSLQETKDALKRFYKRFYSQQFKRSCLPDSVKVGSVSLSPRGDYRMPSDASVATLLNEIDSL